MPFLEKLTERLAANHKLHSVIKCSSSPRTCPVHTCCPIELVMALPVTQQVPLLDRIYHYSTCIFVYMDVEDITTMTVKKSSHLIVCKVFLKIKYAENF